MPAAPQYSHRDSVRWGLARQARRGSQTFTKIKKKDFKTCQMAGVIKTWQLFSGVESSMFRVKETYLYLSILFTKKIIMQKRSQFCDGGNHCTCSHCPARTVGAEYRSSSVWERSRWTSTSFPLTLRIRLAVSLFSSRSTDSRSLNWTSVMGNTCFTDYIDPVKVKTSPIPVTYEAYFWLLCGGMEGVSLIPYLVSRPRPQHNLQI